MAEDQQSPLPPQLASMLAPQVSIADTQRAIAEARLQAEREQKDEAVPGGRYRLASGVFVDAEGNRHKDQRSE